MSIACGSGVPAPGGRRDQASAALELADHRTLGWPSAPRGVSPDPAATSHRPEPGAAGTRQPRVIAACAGVTAAASMPSLLAMPEEAGGTEAPIYSELRGWKIHHLDE